MEINNSNQTDRTDRTDRSDPSGKIRSFIAVAIPEAMKEELGRLESRLKRSDADIKWVQPGSIHITLRFLGYLDAEQLKLTKEALAAVAAQFRPFPIEAKGWGTFPENQRPRVIWAGLTRGKEELTAIFSSLEQELISRGLGEADRPFAGHLTIGRVKSGKKLDSLLEYLRKENDKTWGAFEAGSICLFQSQLHPSGAVYTALREEALRGERGEE